MHFFVDEKPEPFMFYFQVETLFNSSSSSAYSREAFVALLVLTCDRGELWAPNTSLISAENTAQKLHLPHIKEGKMLLFCQENGSIYLMQRFLQHRVCFSSPFFFFGNWHIVAILKRNRNRRVTSTTKNFLVTISILLQ